MTEKKIAGDCFEIEISVIKNYVYSLVKFFFSKEIYIDIISGISSLFSHDYIYTILAKLLF